LLDYYLWIKACHFVAVICWMAGMLYLPRLFVYHATAILGSDSDQMLRVMERRLLRYIMNPSMILTFLFGGALLCCIDFLPWLHIKIFLVVVMAGLHGMLSYYHKQFARGQNCKSHTFFRILNEAPTVVMIIIVILAVVKPF
jgi:protoporphyrinogen IX oxidase